MKQIALFISIILTLSWAQDGYFQSIDNLSIVRDPVKAMSSIFLWRSQNNGQSQFVKVELNGLLYKTKYAFRWPAEIPPEARPTVAFSNPNLEIIFNDNLILTDTSALTAIYKGSTRPLQNIPLPGIVLVNSPQQAEIRQLTTSITDSRAQQMPRFIESSNNEDNLYLVSAENFVPKIIDLSLKPGVYRALEIRLEPLARFRLPIHTLNIDSLRGIENDSLRLLAIEGMLAQSKKWFEEDSIQAIDYLENIAQMIPEQSGRQFAKIIQDIRKTTKKNARSLNDLDKALMSIREKIKLLESYQQEILSSKDARDRWRIKDPQRTLLRQNFDGRIYFGTAGIIGRNMPKSASDPGPLKLWGAQASLSWLKMLGSKLLIEPQFSYLHTQWQFNQDQPKISRQANLGASLLFDIPLLVAPKVDSHGQFAGGGAILLSLGPTLQGRNSWIQDFSENRHRQTYSVGGVVQLRTAFTALPLVLVTSYTLCLDRYGDLTFGISFPLKWISPIGAKS